MLALARPSPLSPLPPPTVHFKIRVLIFALVLWRLLAGLCFHSSDIRAGFQRGQSLSWFWFQTGLDGVGGGCLFSPRPLCCAWCFLIGFAGGRRARVAP